MQIFAFSTSLDQFAKIFSCKNFCFCVCGKQHIKETKCQKSVVVKQISRCLSIVSWNLPGSVSYNTAPVQWLPLQTFFLFLCWESLDPDCQTSVWVHKTADETWSCPFQLKRTCTLVDDYFFQVGVLFQENTFYLAFLVPSTTTLCCLWVAWLVIYWHLSNEDTSLFIFLSLHVVCKYFNSPLIGVSLSEPHASVTALHKCVCTFACLLACFLGPTTYRKFQMSAFKYFTKINIVHEAVEAWLSECSVGDPEWKRPMLKHAWQLNSDLCFYRRQQAAHRRYKNMDGGWLPGSLQVGPCINDTHKRQKFSSWFRCKA